MEASSSKREKKRSRIRDDTDLDGNIPEAPRLEDFVGATSQSFEPEISSPEVDTTTPDESELEAPQEVPLLEESSPEVVEATEDLAQEVEATLSLSDESLDPCEDCLAIPTAPETSYKKTSQQQSRHLYPSLHTGEEAQETSSVADGREAVASNIIVKNASATIEIPVGFLQLELNSKVQHLYSNAILENCEHSVNEFLKSTKTSYEGFELYELLCNYLRAYNQLVACEKNLNELREKCTDFEQRLWSVRYETLSENSSCDDGNIVVATHKYLVADFDQTIYNQVDRAVKDIKELVKDSFSLFTYSVALCKTQINHFFHKSFKDINLESFEVQGYYSGYPNGELQSCANLLRLCISTLFVFIRRPAINNNVLGDCQTWLTNCVGLLLRIATLDDHIFIINHVIRCPSGMINKKLALCVQIPRIPIPSSHEEYVVSGGFSHLNLDYALTVLKLILNPVPKRDDFLKQAESGIKMSPTDSHHQWVVVDSDGEDEPEDVAFFKESDLVALLHQIPFDQIFRRILMIYKTCDGEDVYEIQTASERSMLKLLAFGGQLINILGQGFVSYYTDRYRQLVKMIGRLILHCVQYITDHVEIFVNHQVGQQYAIPGGLVLAEYGLFFRNAVGILHSGKNIGTLQFLAAMPFHFIEMDMLWHVYSAITKWTVTNPLHLDVSCEFENELVSMNESDAFYLLTALSNMAIAREDKNFTQVVLLHLFQIGFLSPLTRDCCSKTARDLLGSLTRKSPDLISVLLQNINAKMSVLDKLSLYLLKELAFELWKPTIEDMRLLRHWLVSFPANTIESQTAKFVLQSMNWNLDATGELFLPFEIHYQIALMIMESTLRWKRSTSFLNEGIKQMNVLSYNNQDEWEWDMMKILHLHGFDRISQNSSFSDILKIIPTFESHCELESVRKGIEAKVPLACLMNLFITPVGHSVPLICQKGFDLLEMVLQSGHWDSALQSLFFITPLFVDCVQELHNSEKFRSILSTLLSADMTYLRMAKNLISSEFPGEVTKMFGEMIQAQITQCSKFDVDEASIVKLWTECLTKSENWNKEQNTLYLLDIIAKASLTRIDCDASFRNYFATMYKEMPSSSPSGISSLFNWSTPVTSLITNPSYSQTPYFLYYILSIEMELENSSGFWKSLCINLNKPKLSLDAAVKKSAHSCKFSTSTNFLTIYRWGQLVIDLPIGHELTFLAWQKFFLRYFHRVSDSRTTQHACVAGRFFEGMFNASFHGKLKKKLMDLLSDSREKIAKFESEMGKSENASENPAIIKELLTDKLNMANALVLWIEDNQLLQETLYLPALAPQYLPTVLLSLMDGEEGSWRNYTDFESILEEERMSARTFLVAINRTCWFDGYKLPRFSELRIATSNCVEDILKRLKSYDKVLGPPAVPVFEEVIPSVSTSMFLECKAMQNGLKPHFLKLREFSKSFSLQISQMVSLNCSYTEILPDLYSNNPAEMLVNTRCGGKSGSKSWENCSGPGRVIFKYKEAKLNETLGHQIHQNRTEYQKLLDEKGTKPPPSSVSVAAVFIEDFITNLAIHFRQSSQNHEEYQRISSVGCELFYYASGLVNDDMEFYPPTRQLLSSLLEVLGREFISSMPNQSQRLVTTAIRNPKLIGSLAPHLNLAACPSNVLIEIYSEITKIPRTNVDLAFVILTKLDVNSWLKQANPRFNDRSQLISIIWKALIADGFTPEDERLMVYDAYRNHFRNMLLYDFPQHYGEILSLLLEGMDHNKISVHIWYDFCNALSRYTIRFNPGMDPFLRKREAKRFATEGSILNHQELISTANMLAQHFTKDRLLHGIYGLYSTYRSYIEPLSCFLQMIAYNLVSSALKHSNGALSQNILDTVWPSLRDLYSPWMLPYNPKFIQQNCAQWIQHMNFDNSSVLQPWINSDSTFAMIIVNDFTDCLMFLVETLPGNSTIFSYLWNFYIENFAVVGVKEHVLGVLHNCFISIPWAMYWPTFSDVELMCRVVERFLPPCHSFLSILFAQISWLEWINNLGPKFVGKGHAMVLNLTVRLGNDSVARESPTWLKVMEIAETRMNWLSIPAASLEPILNWLVMSIDPRVVFDLDLTHRMDKALLRLLETACGYRHSEALSSSHNAVELNTKRYYFIRSYVRLVVSASSKHKSLLETQPKAFEVAIKNMINELARTVKLEAQPNDLFVTHLRELMNLMSNHSLGTTARNAVLEWCNSADNHTAVFLFAVIQLSYNVKVPPYLTAPLLEAVIKLCFQYSETSWTSICGITVVNPEDWNNFFDIASKDGHYLLLYSLLLRRFQNLLRGGLTTICFLMDVMKNIKPKESNEEALPLVFEIMIKIALLLYQEACSPEGSNEAVIKSCKKFLLSFAQQLLQIGDDKQGWGLLGALGIGKTSQLSVRGRLFSKCLGTFVLAQLPVNAAIRIRGESEGHFAKVSPESTDTKPHPDIQGCLEKLTSLKLNRVYGDVIECIDATLTFVQDPENSLTDSQTFISLMNSYLFSARYLVQQHTVS